MKRFKIILVALVAATMIQAVPITANAKTNNDTSKSIVTQNTVSDKTIKIIDIQIEAKNGSDITAKVQQALDVARDFAMDSVPYRIIIPKGTYTISSALEIYSNTQICAEGAHIIKQSFSGGMLRTAFPKGDNKLYGYSGYKNIKIVGGIWDGNAESQKYGEGKCNVFSSFRFAHATNITLENLSITNNVGSHHLELGGIDGATITGCTFEGYKDGGISGGKEAIQLDVMYSSEVFVGYPAFDDTPCINVKISNNTFKNVNRGVGNHTAVNGVYFENVEVTNNIFENITQQSILALNWKDCNISNNIMRNVGSGVDFKYMEPTLYNNPKVGSTNIDSQSKSTISNNIISISSSANENLPYIFGIRAWGATINEANNSNSILEGNYFVEGVDIFNNNITALGRIDTGISGKLMNDSKIYNNIVDFSNSKGNENSRGIYLRQSNNNTIENNTCHQINGTGGNGIHLSASDKNIIKTNTITDCTGNGISLNTYSNENQIIGGNVLGNSVNGISLNSSSANIIKNISDIKGNGNYGIIISNSSSSNKVIGVKVDSNKKSGIAVSGSSSSNTLTNNVSKNNGGNGVLIYNSANNIVSSSSFSANKNYGLTISGNSRSNKATLCNSNNNKKGQAVITGKSSNNNVDVIKTDNKAKGTLPSIPQGVKLGGRTSTKIKLQWSKSENASGYYVYRKDNNGIYKKIKTIEGNSILSFIDSGLTPNKSYSYRITAYYKSNGNVINSSYSKTVSYTTLLKATDKFTGTSTKNTITLKWNKVSGATGYYVYRYDAKSNSYKTLITFNNENSISVRVTGLNPNTKYTYKVMAFKKTNSGTLKGDISKALSVTTKK